MADEELLTTALHAKHVALEAKMSAEAGWLMPLSYRGPLDEAAEVRRRAGICDVSHLGRIRFRGDEALDLLERLCTADVARQEDDTAVYTLLCNERGGIVDEGFLLRLENFWVLTCSAINRGKVLAHAQAIAADFDAKVDDQTPKTAMVAVSGPAARAILDAVLPMRVSDLPRGAARTGSLMIARYIAMRTSYTGEWGLEVILPKMVVSQAWRFITEKAGANVVSPFGLAARDVLRIEAALPRYGHELNETIDPVTAGLEGAVDFEHDFLGREAVAALKNKSPARRRVGLVLAAAPAGGEAPPAVPRLGTAVRTPDGGEVGAVTSGTYSPTLGSTIAMAYVAPEAAQPGTALLVGTEPPQSAQVVELPFGRRGAPGQP